ncbi:MAG: hypothetical protein OXN84_10140, partial [Albidovulum sp.]|nr:hypothetical protein [Albidovulum sp.]
LGIDRRQALWDAKAIADSDPLPLFADELDGEPFDEPPVNLPEMSLGEHVVEDYVSMRLTLRAHPVALLRHLLTPEMVSDSKSLRTPSSAKSDAYAGIQAK